MVNDELASYRESKLYYKYDQQRNVSEQLHNELLGMHTEYARLRELHGMLTQIISESFTELEQYREAERRSRPRFEFHNDVLRKHPDPPVELQWLVYDLITQHHNHIDLNMVVGILALESNWQPCVINPDGPWIGLAQIERGWLVGRDQRINLAPYRLTEDYYRRDLLDPEHNILTLIELHDFFMSRFGYDSTCAIAQNRFIWWHASGRHSALGENGNRRTRLVLNRFAENITLYESEDIDNGQNK